MRSGSFGVRPRSDPDVDIDALVVGAGPSGSVTARQLALSGWRVMLIDREPIGRDRVCGGFLGPEAHTLLERIGLRESLEHVPAGQLRGVTFSGPRVGPIEAPLPGPECRAVDRRLFDAWLCRQVEDAGAVVHHSAQLVDADRVPHGGWHTRIRINDVPRQVVARELIYATGRREQRVPRAQQAGLAYGCKTTYTAPAGAPGRVELHVVRAGHVGINPLVDGRMNVCLSVAYDRLHAARGDFDRLVATLADENPQLGTAIRGAKRLEPWYGCQAQPGDRPQFSRDGAWLVGDAGTMANTFIGGGLSLAMASAVLLARCLTDGAQVAEPRAITARRYEAQWQRQFGGACRFGQWLARCERAPWAAHLLLRLVACHAGLLRAMMRASRPATVSRELRD